MAYIVVFLDLGNCSYDYIALAQFPGAFALEWSALDSLSGCFIQPSLLHRLNWKCNVVCAIWLSLRSIPANTKHRNNPLGNPVGESPIG
jgi:hypothetical protein